MAESASLAASLVVILIEFRETGLPCRKLKVGEMEKGVEGREGEEGGGTQRMRMKRKIIEGRDELAWVEGVKRRRIEREVTSKLRSPSLFLLQSHQLFGGNT